MVVRFELQLLSELGFGLDLERCVATGVSGDLVYVSPKSGRAVSRLAGEPWADKMLRLPAFLRDTRKLTQPGRILADGFALTGLFPDPLCCWSRAVSPWATSARISSPRSIAPCQASRSTGRPRGATIGTPSGMVLLSVAVAVVTRASPPTDATPAAAPRAATTPNPAADVSDVLAKLGSVYRFSDAGGHSDRHGIGAIRYRSRCKNGKRGGSHKYNPAHCFLHLVETPPL